MKIKEVTQPVSSVFDSKKIQKEEPKGVEFQKLLKEADVRLNHESKRISLSLYAGEVKELSPAISSAHPLSSPMREGDITQLRHQSIQATENTLKVLEKYEEAMANPEISLKKIDPIIQSLSHEINGLNLLSEKLSPSDPLKEILMEIGILSAVEVEKFRRGEYI